MVAVTLDDVREALRTLYREREGIYRMYRFLLGRLGIRELPTVKFYYSYMVMSTDDRVIHAIGMTVDKVIIITYFCDCECYLHELYHFVQKLLGRYMRSRAVEVEARLWARSVIRSDPTICSRHFNIGNIRRALAILEELWSMSSRLYRDLVNIFSDLLV